MQETIKVADNGWRTVCNMPMLLALVAVIVGSAPLFGPCDCGGDVSPGDLMFMVPWAYGMLGLALCYLEDATLKKALGIVGLAWSGFTLLWMSLSSTTAMDGAALVYPFGRAGNMVLLAACLAAGMALLAYERHRDTLPEPVVASVKWGTRLMLAAWLFIPVAIVALIVGR